MNHIVWPTKEKRELKTQKYALVYFRNGAELRTLYNNDVLYHNLK
jgi:hypothetical protein